MNQFLFCLSVIPRQEVEWAQISKNDMLRKKGLHFQFIVSDQTLTCCEYLKKSAKEFLEQDHETLLGFDTCVDYFTYVYAKSKSIPHIPN